jgi:hypothetical protein
MTPLKEHDTLYRQYEEEQFVAVLEQSESLINQFSGDELFRNLNFESQYHWKIRGLGSYKMHYSLWRIIPNTEEGKKARNFEGPNLLEKLDFTTTDTKN